MQFHRILDNFNVSLNTFKSFDVFLSWIQLQASLLAELLTKSFFLFC